MYEYHRDGTLPRPHNQWVWCFGSNLAGVHGAGAAKVAIKYGARPGVGVGLSKMSYAIPTKDHDIKTLPLDKIEPYIDRFKKFTLDHKYVKFWVTAVGCGLAGYKDADIAPMFKGCGPNCSFPIQWKPYLE
jgi:hypothetical protein